MHPWMVLPEVAPCRLWAGIVPAHVSSTLSRCQGCEGKTGPVWEVGEEAQAAGERAEEELAFAAPLLCLLS